MPEELTETNVFALLSERSRRTTLQVLQEISTPVSVFVLAKHVAWREYDTPSATRVNAVYRSLSREHLPYLSEADAIRYDHRNEVVRPGANFGVLVGALDRLNERGRQWTDERG